MRPIPSLLVATVSLAAGLAQATPTPCVGRYLVDGAPLDFGGAATNVPAVGASRLVTTDGAGQTLTMSIGRACEAATVVQAPRDDAFVLRGRFVGCGDVARMRVRLAFDADCTTVAGRVRSRGRLLRAFTARLDTGTPPVVAPPNPFDPGAGTAVPVVRRPVVSVFEPAAARAGDLVTLFGHDLDRSGDGQPWTGVPPYVVEFARAGGPGARVTAVPSFESSTRLRVRVPARAGTGVLRLVARRGDGSLGGVIVETTASLLVVATDSTPPPAPTAGTPPPTSNTASVTIQSTALNAIEPGVRALQGSRNQAGAFVDRNRNAFVDLADPTGSLRAVPYLAFPVRTSESDFSIAPGSGYFAGADAMLWFILGDVAPGLPGGDVFVTVHLDVDVAAGTARPVGIVAGIAQQPGIVLSTDLSGFSAFDIQVEAPVVNGPGAIRGSLAAVPTFLEQIFIPSQVSPCFDPSGFCPDFGPEVEQRLWANGIVVDFDLPLFADAG